MVLNVMPFVHSAAVNSAHISISADERIKTDGISKVVVTMFLNLVPWTVVWCFGRHADTFRGGGSNQKCHNAALINSSSTKVNPSVTKSNVQFRVSRLKRSMRSGGVSELAETGSRTEDLCSHLSPSQSSLFLQCNSVSAVDRIRVRKSRL